jgi:hypothetical protein
MEIKFRLKVSWLALSLMFPLQTFAQSTILKNSIDAAVSIRDVTIAPLSDNVSNIYAVPMTEHLRTVVEDDRQWPLKKYPTGESSTVEAFEDNPKAVQSLLKKAAADTLLAGRITKGPNGINIKLNLFSANDGQLLAQEILQDYSGFEVKDLKIQLENIYAKLKSKLPYGGVVLSRKGNLVTINAGFRQGLQQGQDVSIIQILKINRHPRFKFIISAEKEIIGKIRINKAEESLSFGDITLERTEGVIQPAMKIMPVTYVAYSPKPTDGIVSTDNAREWVPKPSPSFGMVGLMLGIGNNKLSNTVNSIGAVEGTNTFAPMIRVNGELWLTTNWFMGLDLRQYLFSVENGYAGSTPREITVSALQTSLQLGYNLLMTDEYFGPKFQFLGGYSKMTTTVDTSQPTAYTSLGVGGFALGIGGFIPLATEPEDLPITLGAKLLFFLNNTVEESPVSSGAGSSGKITSFSAFGIYRWTEHMNIKGQLDYDLFSASFSGTGTRTPAASSWSHTMTTISGGIEYLF